MRCYSQSESYATRRTGESLTTGHMFRATHLTLLLSFDLWWICQHKQFVFVLWCAELVILFGRYILGQSPWKISKMHCKNTNQQSRSRSSGSLSYSCNRNAQCWPSDELFTFTCTRSTSKTVHVRRDHTKTAMSLFRIDLVNVIMTNQYELVHAKLHMIENCQSYHFVSLLQWWWLYFIVLNVDTVFIDRSINIVDRSTERKVEG